MARQLSRLAREELRHFEQVETLMQSLGVARRRMTPSRYASGLRRHVACNEPERQLDLLAIGALIEARSCERFERLAPRLSGPMAELYRGLCESEARHGQLYLDLARRHAGAQGLDFEARIARFSQLEAQLITRPDPEFRFHSGLPEALGR
jgi:tRNA-(ms[2]io[6]A)-hydroxylase